MNARSLLTNIISLVSYTMRRDALLACVQSLMNGSAASVTCIGRGIRGVNAW